MVRRARQSSRRAMIKQQRLYMVSPALVPIRQNDVKLGKPLPWPVYDENGKLLLASGAIVETQSQLEGLVQYGYCAESPWNSAPSRSPRLQKTVKPEEEKEEPAKELAQELDKASWNVGETIYLQLHDNPAVRFTVKLIGFLKNKSILVSPPTADGKAVLIRDGQTFIVRAFPGQKAYAFTSSVLKSVFSPYPYLHLTYPPKVSCTTIRKGARVDVKIIASVSLGSPAFTAAATLVDLSTGGAAGIAKAPMGTKGQTGTIKFKVHAAGADEYLSLNMVLRSVMVDEGNDGYRHGFEFQDVPSQARLILSAFVHQTLAEAV